MKNTELNWALGETYNLYLLENKDSIKSDDSGNRFIFDKYRRIIYRMSIDCDEFWYIYLDDIVYVRWMDEDEEEKFYKCDIKNNTIETFITKELNEKDFLFTIYLDDDKEEYMNIKNL